MYIDGLWMEVFELARKKSVFLSKGELLQNRNLPFKAKMFRATTATSTRGVPAFIRVPSCGVVGHSSLELGRLV